MKKDDDGMLVIEVIDVIVVMDKPVEKPTGKSSTKAFFIPPNMADGDSYLSDMIERTEGKRRGGSIWT